MNTYVLTKSNLKDKKFSIYTPNGKKIDFGAKFYSDYLIHKDPKRRERYILRHQKRENWNKSGILTKGFWAYHILWNKPILEESIRDTEKRFNINIIYI